MAGTLQNYLVFNNPKTLALHRNFVSGYLPRMERADPESNESVAKRLRWLRNHMKLSQREMAETLGISTNRYNNWERGVQRLTLDGGKAVKHLYGLPLDFIFCGETDNLSAHFLKSWIENSRDSSSR